MSPPGSQSLTTRPKHRRTFLGANQELITTYLHHLPRWPGTNQGVIQLHDSPHFSLARFAHGMYAHCIIVEADDYCC